MQNQLHITVRDMEHFPALDDHIRQKVGKLEQCCSRILSCRVVAEAPHKHHHQGCLYTVRIEIAVPGYGFAVSHDHDEDIYVALRDAFDAAKRRLERYVEEHRGGSKVCQRQLPREAAATEQGAGNE